jgi:hypothetical protein
MFEDFIKSISVNALISSSKEWTVNLIKLMRQGTKKEHHQDALFLRILSAYFFAG